MTTAQHRAKHYKGKHRKQSHRAKTIAAVSVATATATALTVGMAPPPPKANAAQVPVALMASTGPNYTQDIENASNTLDNLLFARANLVNAVGSIVNPLSQASGGLFPHVGATVGQENLLTVDGVIAGLLYVLNKLGTLPDVSNIPGLPPGANALLTQNLGPLLGQLALLLPLADVLDNLNGLPGALDGVQDGLDDLHALVKSLVGPGSLIGTALALANIPLPELTVPDVTAVVDDLLASLGATATLTHYDSDFSWPVLGIGGSTNVTNLFAQIPSLTVDALAAAVLDGVAVPNLTSILGPLGIPVPGALTDLTGLVGDALEPLDLIATPSITAWIPSASGNYTLPLGGSFGYLATMPVVDIGPLTVGNVTVPLNGADTVVAIPIMAYGITLPGNIASFGKLSTPGLVFPTATGVSTLAGTTLKSWTLLGVVNLTSVNTLRAVYVGTNGVNINRGQTAVVLTTPFGVVPFEFSKGAVNFGTTGFGFTGPSVAGVGLLPPIQIGTAPVQKSDDGLLPAAVINAGLIIPTQVTDLATLAGLPNIQTTVIDPFVNPVFNSTFGAAGAAVTAYLDAHVGKWVDSASNGALELSGRFEKLTEKLPDATVKPAAATTTNATLAAPTSSARASAITQLGQSKLPRIHAVRQSLTDAKPAGSATPVKDAVTGLQHEVKKAVGDAQSSGRHAAANLRKALGADKAKPASG